MELILSARDDLDLSERLRMDVTVSLLVGLLLSLCIAHTSLLDTLC